MPILFLQAPHRSAQGLNTQKFPSAGICFKSATHSCQRRQTLSALVKENPLYTGLVQVTKPAHDKTDLLCNLIFEK